jgi:4-azaleucine resistance transporter AzlC
MSGPRAPSRSPIGDGIRESLPLGLALVPVGLAFGYIAQSVGLSWWLAGLMSAVVYAGPSQFIAAGMIGVNAAPVAIVATTFVTNLRYSLFAASLAPFMRDAPPRRLVPLGQAVADGSYALTLDRARAHPQAPRLDQYLLGSFIVSFGFWVPASIAGALLGDVVPDVLAFGLGFATPAIFIAFLIPYVRNHLAVLVMLVAGIGTVLGNDHLPSGTGPLVAIVAAVILGGTLQSRRTPR